MHRDRSHLRLTDLPTRDLKETVRNAQAMVMEMETNQITAAMTQANLSPAVKMVAIVMLCSVESVENWSGTGRTITGKTTYSTSKRFEELYT